jgi:DNA-binding NtrC family response regulator
MRGNLKVPQSQPKFMEKLVYIIDDDPVYLKFMKEHFKLLGGYKAEVFENGDEALERIKVSRPYLIILDNHLKEPNKSGVYYLKKIIKTKPLIPVIYITADTDAELKKQVEKLGVNSYIIKNQSFLIYLRTTLDEIESGKSKGGFLRKFFR